MFGPVLVPHDGSAEAARALRPAATLAHALESPLEVVSFVESGEESSVGAAIDEQLQADDISDATVTLHRRCAFVADQVESLVAEQPNSLVCMSTHGRGRTAAVIGSVAEDLIRLRSGPIVLVGPDCDLDRYRPGGTMVVPLDGTEVADGIVSVATAFAIVMHHPLVFLTVAQPVRAGDVAGTALSGTHVRTAAARAAKVTGDEERFEVLRGKHPGQAVAMRANDPGVAMIGMATHGRFGFDRLVKGSVTGEVVAQAPCPVLVMQPFDH
ncbi:MAG: universal stress protein [Acidimicrobiia bacterium]|nr:universal stress protein [Acidimicrobiia bacterium]